VDSSNKDVICCLRAERERTQRAVLEPDPEEELTLVLLRRIAAKLGMPPYQKQGAR
jgi:hypothetical protein